MAVELYLKKRGQSDTARVSLRLIREIMSQDGVVGKDRLWELFDNIKDAALPIHDKIWLETLVNWMPTTRDMQGRMVPKPVPLTDKYKWIKLIQRVAELDEDREGPFTLSQLQADILWKRLVSKEFEIVNLPIPFIEFLLDLQEAYGKQLPEIEIDEEVTKPKGKVDEKD